MIDESPEPPEDEPVAETAPEEPAAEAPAAPEAPAPAAAAPAAPEPDDDEDDEPAAPRVKPAIPGADLEVDIVLEGADPLAQEEADAAAEAEAEQDRADETPVAAVIDLAAGARYRATGKRKTAVARVILRPGTGAYTCNGKPLDTYFPRPALGRNIRQPLEADPNLRGELKRRGFLTRDSRAKERKKAGLKKARKKPQFSKR